MGIPKLTLVLVELRNERYWTMVDGICDGNSRIERGCGERRLDRVLGYRLFLDVCLNEDLKHKDLSPSHATSVRQVSSSPEGLARVFLG